MKRTLLASLLLAAACGGGGTQTPTGGGTATGGDPTGGTGGGAPTDPGDPALAARTQFENPGGMWMPRQMTEHAQELAALGIGVDPAALSDPTKAPLSAVVSIGGCSASFVSPDGLIVTNHHCVQQALQLNSTEQENLVENGFLAKSRADERSAGPAGRVYVAQKLTVVTDQIMQGLDAIQDPVKRHEEIEKREKAVIAACEQDRPGIRCKTASFFKGLEWQLHEYLEIRDLRLVYVPHRGIGNYGGEIDNWAWPRHTGDYAFLRAYVAQDGAAADFSPENVPFKPAAFLKVQAEGVDAHDLVFIAGYPGRTGRQMTASELRHDAEWTHPRFIEKSKQKMELLVELQKAGGETAIKAGVGRQRVQNFLEKYSGILDGLQNTDLIAQKDADEKAFRAWAAQDPSRAKYVDALDRIEKLNAERWAAEQKHEAWLDAAKGSTLLDQAHALVKWSEESVKPDADRKLGYQERDKPLALARQKTFAKSYDPTIDRAMWKLMLTRATQDPTSKDWLPAMLGLKKGAKVDAAAIDKALDAMYGKTKLHEEKVRLGLFAAKPSTLKTSKDPFIRLALKLRPKMKELEDKKDAWMGEMLLVAPVWAEGFLAFKGGKVAPDANGTLRLTYGTVRGYAPAPGKEPYKPFTTVLEIPKKNTGEQPFDAPKRLLDAIAAGEWGPYAAPELGTVPVDFLADTDITNGNSGSAVLNGKGELVGLAFDGNGEGLTSDVMFAGDRSRTIAADIRYVLWVADAVDQADNVLQEMGITPAL